MEQAFLKTPLGTAIFEGDEKGVSKISITNEKTDGKTDIPPVLKLPVQQLHEYFEGKRNEFSFKTNPKGTEFQKKVWEELRKTPFGKTLSYSQLSKKIGSAKAVRAVAAANGKNPLWVVVPCHRIIGNDGSLTGYAGGLWRKKWLLEHETPPNQQRLF